MTSARSPRPPVPPPAAPEPSGLPASVPPPPPAETPPVAENRAASKTGRKTDHKPDHKAAATPARTGAPRKRTGASQSKSGKSAPKKRRGKKRRSGRPGRGALFFALEWGALLAVAALALMVALGYAGQYLSGPSFLRHRLPFALAAALATVAGALALLAWWRRRKALQARHPALPMLAALCLLAAVLLPTAQGRFAGPLAQFRLLLGGRAEMRSDTLRHQVFAGYRRLNAADMDTLFARAAPFQADIEAAARAFGLDPDILYGLAAVESSFLPRPSADGGQGLFQLTSIPEAAKAEALRRLKADALDPDDPRHNSFAAAATLKNYLGRMRGDMILALLAYNIGPQNGGLADIMSRYGATDFITIQPYLQEKPRTYPVRALACALAFRVRRVEGRLLPYEEGENARRVQRIGIPGL